MFTYGLAVSNKLQLLINPIECDQRLIVVGSTHYNNNFVNKL